MSQPTHKSCPRCGKVVLIHTPECDGCGRVYNTKWSAEPTVAFTPPNPAPPTMPTTWTQPPSSEALQWKGFLFVLVIGALMLFAHFAPESQPTTVDAWLMAKQFVTDNLKSPATAQFPSYGKENVQALDGGDFQVAGYVDSQNGFGALLRTDWTCRLHYQGREKWLLRGLRIGEDTVGAMDDAPAPTGLPELTGGAQATYPPEVQRAVERGRSGVE